MTFSLGRPCRVYGDVEGLLTAASSAPQVPGLYVGLAKDVINVPPAMTLVLSLDSYIFFATDHQFRAALSHYIHAVSSKRYVKDLALDSRLVRDVETVAETRSR